MPATNPETEPVAAVFPNGDNSANNTIDSRPHYQRIYADISERIASGSLAYGDQLPVLADLCAQYNVSEAPVRRALDELARVGLIIRLRGRGKGTFVHKRIAPPTVIRVLLLGFDLHYTAIEACHEAFGLIAGIRAAASERGFTVHTVTETALGNLAPATNGVRIGYLVISTNEVKYAEGARIAASQNNAAYVLVNAPEAVAGANTVRVDMEQGAFLGVEHLASQGHSRIAYLGSTGGAWFAPRVDGYRRALVSAGIPFDPSLVRSTRGIDAAEDAAALDALLALPSPPTAIFACSDYRALHLLEHAQNHLGLLVPRDFSLCGYDDIGACETVKPTLTSVYHPLFEQGEAALSLLLSAMEAGPHSHDIQDRLLPPRLIVRESSTPLPLK